MFVCLNCGDVFDEPIRWKEYLGERFGEHVYEYLTGSPCCKHGYEEAYKCDCCDDWIVDGYIKTDDGHRYCENCILHYELGEEQ